ncbi:MAG: hypothetical protein ABI895_11710 [Deltaproteobacteria bacterium]
MQARCGFVRWWTPCRWLGPARWVALGCSVAWIAGPARAAEAEPILAHIDWHGAICGDAAQFATRISARTERVRFVSRAEQLRLAVRIEARGIALRANVTFLAVGKAPVVRRIESRDCNDALDALALVVAISVDQRWRERAAAAQPAARPRPTPRRPAPLPPSSTEPEAPGLDPGEGSVTIAPSTLAASPPPEPKVVTLPLPARPAQPAPAALVAPPDAAPSWSWAGGVGARLLSGATPEALLGGELWLRAGWERESVFSPDFALSVAHDRGAAVARAEGSVEFALSAAALELCPLRFGTRRLRLQPCFASTLGWLRASGRRTFRAHTESSPWWTLGGGAQAIASIGGVALRLAGGVAHPLERPSYRFLSASCTAEDCAEPAFHRVAPVVWSIGLGAGLSFR